MGIPRLKNQLSPVDSWVRRYRVVICLRSCHNVRLATASRRGFALRRGRKHVDPRRVDQVPEVYVWGDLRDQPSDPFSYKRAEDV
jgi:hypothetical protein